MTNDELLWIVAMNAEKTLTLCKAVWTQGALNRAAADELVQELHRASAAAVELQRRATGTETKGEK